eukprot:4458443-Amphidinium_carterae.1
MNGSQNSMFYVLWCVRPRVSESPCKRQEGMTTTIQNGHASRQDLNNNAHTQHLNIPRLRLKGVETSPSLSVC